LDLDDFFKQAEEDIVEIQKTVVHSVMQNLFKLSPHHILAHEDKEYTEAEKEQYAKDMESGTTTFKNPKTKETEYRRAAYANSEYDANHKISTNTQTQSSFVPATMSHLVSFVAHSLEKSKIDTVNKIGDKINIENISAHADEVEFGIGWKSTTPAYCTYTKADMLLNSKFKGLIK